ncbi:MAG: DUF1549 and DUF1553 domain-containing protein [Gemmataceae bacterium]
MPAVKAAGWARNPVDALLLAKMEAKGLTPSPEADRRVLVRRLFLDLLGLPPTPDEIEAFLADRRPDAYERLVDRLLASPAYGERWGRHWLDVARYADTKGYVFQEERRYPYSYTYRDYVIGAFNDDLPYDRFLVHQIAADAVVKEGEDRRVLAAMGFLTLGRRFLNNIHDIIDDRIDVVGRGLMGLTVGCARCHDHKYDPVSMKDYYSLHGVFASSNEPGDLPLLAAPPATGPGSAFEKELQARQAKVDAFLRTATAEASAGFRARAVDYLLAASDAKPLTAGDLTPMMVGRWRAYLAQAAKGHHPVLAPFVAFARLPQAEYAAKAPGYAARIAADAEKGKPINPRVAKAFAGPPPASLADVARKYEALFREAEAAWVEASKRPGATRLDDAPLEAIRQVLHGAGAPPVLPAEQVGRFLRRDKREQLTALRRRVDQWRASGPNSPPRAMVLVDNPTPATPRVLLRGNPGNPGPVVPRQFLEVVDPARQPFRQGSGRLELARAIASKDNPLTARVMVNRVWMHHFGRPLVPTPGDFGLRGEPPLHPELIDFLATAFVDAGWSVKHLHRLILLSATYRQASDDRDPMLALDPDNAFYWRMNRRRLEFESLRDSLLVVAGTLDPRMGGPGVDITAAPFPPRRSVYGFIDRQNLPGVFRTFDLASPDSSTPRRHQTTVPQQSLFLMNSPFVQDLARAFVARPDVVAQPTDEARIDRMIRLAHGRPAEPDEVQAAVAFVRTGSGGGLTPWERYAQVLLLSNEFAFAD